MPFINKTIKKPLRREAVWEIYISKIVQITTNVDIINRNYCVSLLRKTKTNFHANLNEKDLTDNEQFCRNVKPLLSDKIKSSEKIILVEQRETLDTDGNIDDEIVNDHVKKCRNS